MKKFAKNCLITAGIMLAIGILICGICFAIGGKEVFAQSDFSFPLTWLVEHESSEGFENDFNTDLENDSKNLVQKAGSIKNSVKKAKNITGSLDHFYNDYPVYEKNHTNENVCKASDIQEISFHLKGGDTTIKPSDTDSFQISYNGHGKLQYFISDGTLHILGFYDKNKEIKSWDNYNDKLTVSIPASATISDYEFNIDAGGLIVKNLTCDQVSLNLGAGEATLKDFTANSFYGEVGAGSLTMKDAELQNFSADVGLGTIEYEGIVSGELDTKCGMGNIECKLDDRQEDHNFNISCSMGSIEVNGHDFSGFDFDHSIDNHSNSTYNLTCAMGSIELNFKK